MMRFVAVLVSAGMLWAPESFAQSKPFELDDVFEFDFVKSAVLSPGGDQVAVVTERWKQDRYGSLNTLWLVTASRGEPRRLTNDPQVSQNHPAWSSDGRMLGYIETRERRNRLRIAAGERASPGSDATPDVCGDDGEVATFTWAPKRARLAVVCQKYLPVTAEKTNIIVASRSPLYNLQSIARSQRTVVLFDVDSGQRTVLMRNNGVLIMEGALFWNSTGDVLWAMGTAPEANYVGELFESRVLHRVEVNSRKVELPAVELGEEGLAVNIGRGDEILVVQGGRMIYGDWRQTYLLPAMDVRRIRVADGKIITHTQRADLYRTMGAWSWATPTADARNGVLYFGWFDRASIRVGSYRPDANVWGVVTPEGVSVTSFSTSADGSRMAVVREDVNTPADVYLVDLKRNGVMKRLTYFGDRIRERHTVASVEELKWRSADDRFTVHGWLLRPADFDGTKRYPMIVDVHGGPWGTYANRFDEIHYKGGHQVPPELYAARGYLVLMVNPRGDPSYGKAYQEALLEGEEYPTRYDILTGVDEVIRLGYANPDRLGIAGASYGGWVTTFAITQTDRFKAASANDPPIDIDVQSAVAYRGENDGNYWLNAGLNHHLPGERPPVITDPSRVRTPVMLRFGLRDMEPTYPSQFFVSGLPYFSYLHARCKPVEMILHTEEGHGIADWKTRRDYIQRDLAWFDYFVKGEGENPLPKRSCPKM